MQGVVAALDRLPFRVLAVLAAALAAVGAALAQQPEPPAAAAYAEATQRWADEALAGDRALQALPLRVEVEVGALDTRLRLAPCAKVEPYLPPGTRLWGRARIGLRCADGAARWNVFLPLTVRAFGPAWVLKTNLAPGSSVRADDLVEAEADWAAEPSPIVADAAGWTGQVAARGLQAGSALRQSMLRPAQVFQAGTQVRVVARGAGFSVAADGQALSAGVVGQLARVRMDNGRVMSGVVLDARTVAIEM